MRGPALNTMLPPLLLLLPVLLRPLPVLDSCASVVVADANDGSRASIQRHRWPYRSKAPQFAAPRPAGHSQRAVAASHCPPLQSSSPAHWKSSPGASSYMSKCTSGQYSSTTAHAGNTDDEGDNAWTFLLPAGHTKGSAGSASMSQARWGLPKWLARTARSTPVAAAAALRHHIGASAGITTRRAAGAARKSTRWRWHSGLHEFYARLFMIPPQLSFGEGDRANPPIDTSACLREKCLDTACYKYCNILLEAALAV